MELELEFDEREDEVLGRVGDTMVGAAGSVVNEAFDSVAVGCCLDEADVVVCVEPDLVVVGGEDLSSISHISFPLHL